MNAEFSQALLDAQRACPSNLCTRNGSDPTQRFAVYRNNIIVSIVDALSETFPVVQALVGVDFFRAMAREFVQKQRCRSRVMTFCGAGLADFVAGFPPAAALPYLADVAHLEMARVLAYHAADAVPVSKTALLALLSNPADLNDVRLHLHPSLQIVASQYAVVTIWYAHQQDRLPNAIDADPAEEALIFRTDADVRVQATTLSEAKFLRQLLDLATLSDALDAAGAADGSFDAQRMLALLVQQRLITAVE